MSKKNKFNLTNLVHQGLVKEGEKLVFVSDNSKIATIYKTVHHEYKLLVDKAELTVFQFVQACLGQEAPDHASKWLKTENGATLYELWQKNDEE
jgi:hypothetical protein